MIFFDLFINFLTQENSNVIKLPQWPKMIELNGIPSFASTWWLIEVRTTEKNH